ncbi:uncharacterized protein A4U43_C01F5050 [Asparagus officinalis]|uniref:C2H2-type domain-containing protein n=2 Tax=Asparagus officinalis TaxID=4686 RepID=A0A5P1FM46_ASPOF|nr:zinc finger protein ZAT2-like isoform X2 [Asparagus officinalis]ONK79308.1 uncharacterized protein A4U43_C01F5050 [Asparagus officinalis]
MVSTGKCRLGLKSKLSKPRDSNKTISAKSTTNLNSCNEPPACPECKKIFPSQKALYGHMRCHPNRHYRGVNKPVRRSADTAEHAAAKILVIMSKSTVLTPIYQCSTCKKTFSTHEALGGHTASHNKQRSNVAEIMEGSKDSGVFSERRCKHCNETFATGQALGGHMRRHYNGILARGRGQSVEIVENKHHAPENVRVEINLNGPPPESDGEQR